MICDNCPLKGKDLVHCKINCPIGKDLYEQDTSRDRLCEGSTVCERDRALLTEVKK